MKVVIWSLQPEFFTADLVAKQLGLRRVLVPPAIRAATLINPAYSARAKSTVDEAEDAARLLGLQTQIVEASGARNINAVFAIVLQERPDALFLPPDPFFVGRRGQLANLAARHAIPASYSTRDVPEPDGLMSYGTDIDGLPIAGT